MYGKELKLLKALRLPGCGITDFDLLGLRPLTQLTLLDICDELDVSSSQLWSLKLLFHVQIVLALLSVFALQPR